MYRSTPYTVYIAHSRCSLHLTGRSLRVQTWLPELLAISPGAGVGCSGSITRRFLRTIAPHLLVHCIPVASYCHLADALKKYEYEYTQLSITPLLAHCPLHIHILLLRGLIN